MAIGEGPPLSSGLYLTMRKQFCASLLRDVRNSYNESELQAHDDFDDASRPYKRGGMVTNNASDEHDVHLALVNMSLKNIPLSPLDSMLDPSVSDDRPDVMKGISFLSGQRCVTGARSRMDLISVISRSKRRHRPIRGRLNDIVDMLNSDGSPQGTCYMSKRVVAGPNGTEAVVGPLSANEVAHLLLLAQKLQETNRNDETLEHDIERSSNMWRESCRVPNVVPTAVVSGLYEGKPLQCSTCGLRLSSADVKQRHMLTHGRGRREVLWATIDDWITNPGQPSKVRSSQKPLVTLQTFRKLLNRQELAERESIKWLIDALFPRGWSASTNTNTALDELGGDYFTEGEDTDAHSLDDPMHFLWSWGTMHTCNVIPNSSDSSKPDVPSGVQYDPFILREACSKVRSNISACMDKVPFAVNFSDVWRKTCVLCHDLLRVEFNTDYNRLVYCDASCFKFDNVYIRKNFQDEDVSCEALLSTEALPSLHDPFLVLRKVAALTFVRSRLKYMRHIVFNDWSLRGEFTVINDQQIVPERSPPQSNDLRVTRDMIKGWKGPFASSEGVEGTPNGLVYSHTDCIKLVLKAHTIWARRLGAGGPCEQDIDALKVT